MLLNCFENLNVSFQLWGKYADSNTLYTTVNYPVFDFSFTSFSHKTFYNSMKSTESNETIMTSEIHSIKRVSSITLNGIKLTDAYDMKAIS